MQRENNRISWGSVIKTDKSHYPADSVICFVDTYPLDSVIKPLNNRGQYFSSQTDDAQPDACGSFVRMENDKSSLAGVCSKWGYDASDSLILPFHWPRAQHVACK